MLSLNSFIFCQKDISELTNFFWQTRQQQFRLSWSSQGSNAFCTTTISREKLFLFLTFCSWFFKTYWTVFLKISALYQDQTSLNSNFHRKTVLIWRDFLETVALFPSQKSTPHSLPLCTLLLVTGSIFLCVLSVQPFTRQFLTEFRQKTRENASSKENIEIPGQMGCGVFKYKL